MSTGRRTLNLSDRLVESENRIARLREALDAKLSPLPLGADHPHLCIYATGSLARREATEHSDLDAFFMLSGEEKLDRMGKIGDVKIFNAVLEAAEEQKFPDFSNEGEYLKFLHIEDVVSNVGSREDDYKNNFTARMLLMLESEWLYNEKEFRNFQKAVIEVYFSDFHDHAEKFRPVFLLNDVLRFWRTLCLNYENARHWRATDELKSAKGHLGNLKLKFSRLDICFSFICHLMAQGEHLSAENAIKTATLTPAERMNEIARLSFVSTASVERVTQEYQWFLDKTGHPKDDTLNWISDPSNREAAFSHAAHHIEAYGEIVKSIAEEHGYLRYFII